MVRVFISWSGPVSRRAAESLKFWLQNLLTDLEVWMSEHDIGAGTPWGTVLHGQLKNSDFGILCLTRENLTAPWLIYEAGALAMSAKVGCVVPYLLGIKSDAVLAPISQFQGAQADYEGTWKIIKSLNDFQAHRLPDEDLEALFQEHWPRLANSLGLDLRMTFVEDIPVVRPNRIHFHNEQQSTLLREALNSLFREGHKLVILDLSEVDAMMSFALPVFYSGLRMRKDLNADLVLANVQPPILGLLKMTKVELLVRVFPTVEDALKSR
jgi:anti-anti-sigma factor